MRTTKLRIVSVQDLPRQVDWSRVLHVTGVMLWWLLTFLWGLTKALVAVVLFIAGVLLIGIGVLAHFVGGPSR
jgi:hypothetical protein